MIVTVAQYERAATRASRTCPARIAAMQSVQACPMSGTQDASSVSSCKLRLAAADAVALCAPRELLSSTRLMSACSVEMLASTIMRRVSSAGCPCSAATAMRSTCASACTPPAALSGARAPAPAARAARAV